MNAIKPRLWHMLLGWGAVGVAYALSDRLQGKGYHLTPMAIDSSIPFSPSAIWLYLSFFLLVPLGYLLVPRDRLRQLTCAMQLSALGAGVIYLLWPTTLHYPTYSSDGSASQLLTWLISVDSPQLFSIAACGINPAFRLGYCRQTAGRIDGGKPGLGACHWIFDPAVAQASVYRSAGRRHAGLGMRLAGVTPGEASDITQGAY